MNLFAQVTINKPIQHVWGYLNEPENLSKWIDDLKKYEHVTGDANDPKPGDTARHTYDQNGREFVMQEEIVEYDAPNRIKLRLTSNMFDLEVINDLEDVDGAKTIVTSTTEFVRTGLLMTVILFFSRTSKLQAKFTAQMERLKRLIEQTH